MNKEEELVLLIKGLKADAYDALATMEYCQARLKEINQAIAEKSKELDDLKKG